MVEAEGNARREIKGPPGQGWYGTPYARLGVRRQRRLGIDFRFPWELLLPLASPIRRPVDGLHEALCATPVNPEDEPWVT